ncbi:hypothetical protein F383_28677 [Gossypium arboreum]|uniref:Uncharacterized protein n=1 Tax=Gossypium arboreum TaxID=29729 RepID=A0A0B0PAP1_GOSAR|nr:hypothetical protein F383_28677 [Gossypium arboreum]
MIHFVYGYEIWLILIMGM